MKKIKYSIKLMRCKSYIKNFFVFIPLFYSTQILDFNQLSKSFISFLSFCLIASTVYVINDIMDIEKDRLHETKRNRPLASGALSVKYGLFLASATFILSIILSITLSLNVFLVIMLYFILNLGYSMKLKNIPIIDVFIISIGFMLRVFAGALAINVIVSNWLFLVVFFLSLFLGFSKRYSEIILKPDFKTRPILESYGKEFLKQAVWTCMGLTTVMYSLWCIDQYRIQKVDSTNLLLTIPIVIYAFLEYILYIEKGNDGDPVVMIYNNKKIIVALILYIIVTSIVLIG